MHLKSHNKTRFIAHSVEFTRTYTSKNARTRNSSPTLAFACVHAYACVCTRMHAYASRMHRVCNVCTAYAHVCTRMHRVCTAYAPRMHRVCTAYAPRMRVCISQCRVCTPYARYPYEWLESYACDFSTQLRESNKHSTKIYQDFANERSLGGALDLEMQAPVGLAPSQREQRWHAW